MLSSTKAHSFFYALSPSPKSRASLVATVILAFIDLFIQISVSLQLMYQALCLGHPLPTAPSTIPHTLQGLHKGLLHG